MRNFPDNTALLSMVFPNLLYLFFFVFFFSFVPLSAPRHRYDTRPTHPFRAKQGKKKKPRSAHPFALPPFFSGEPTAG